MTDSNPKPGAASTLGIRRNNYGLYCLDDIHQALGAKSDQTPGVYMALERTIALVDAVGAAAYRDAISAGNPAPRIELVHQSAETYVHEGIAIDFAAWVSRPLFPQKEGLPVRLPPRETQQATQ
ncbi:KilA-N domain-containing protein [Dyella sp.]|uniref:KilA-N domain-containing protein n=1 Tax=Dyella sp. TaxID=1869338 RepID=UPI00283FD365|nr:KilA-N domain-containing protein [Dyella sp.]MDR3446267.1 KilA-N domain-containing protein [Dyella sp.]